MRTTSERFTRLVAWRLTETLCTRWSFLANAGAVALFAWVVVCVVLALVGEKPSDYQSAVAITCLAVAAYFSGMVAKMIAGVACARQHRFGNNAVTMASAQFTDLCFAMALATMGAISAPLILGYLGSAGAGAACSALLCVIVLCIAAILPTAHRMSGPDHKL